MALINHHHNKNKNKNKMIQPLVLVVVVVFCFACHAPRGVDGKTIKFYLHQKFGTNEFGTVPAAVPPVPPTRNGVGLQVVYNYPATKGASNSSKSLGFVRGTSVVVNNTASSTVFFVSNVFHYDDGKNVGTFSQQGEADFASGNPWEFAVIGGTGYFRNVYGFNRGQVYSVTPVTNSTPIIVTKYRARLSFKG